ncbi:PadR family transcriptional regulator [Cellulomonas pakistanensis]|uniref:PadR family transcriptional regulator n=1 Tax=Cellulomonas pakistanensis TaxID=992287 RepID=A0A919U351_9CELL|nr:PadR family transcriptional regulator [Cellulomonas pakistanensis]GIG35921.1 PadR family transcriptional regulator [Cellulomonas pakistanensis]
MASQMTEMLKGTLEGIVLAILEARPAYGYEITAQLRDEGFADLAEGTVYALLVRIEQRGFVDVTKVPSEKGPPRKVYTLNAAGRAQLDEFWATWAFLAGRIEHLRAARTDSTTSTTGTDSGSTHRTTDSTEGDD